ncbi:MAG: response regulator [Candidatus Omnitrophota bacterium]|nr:response regulator [Candidatus Omnitrophota bacterium]MDZ4243414.1 response regulator [Candidatus Omnitrophota bacterium]
MAKKILVVDDEADLVSMLELRLSANGFQVIKAFDGVQGLEKVRVEKPDLIIADVLMPKMDGFAFYKELKKAPGTSNIPVIILTARGKMEETFRVMGVDHFVTKPFDAADLVGKILGMLGVNPDAAPAQAPASPKPETVKEPPSPKPEPAKAPEKPSTVKGKRVLLAGSSTGVLDRMERAIRSGKYACEICPANQNVYDVVAFAKPDLLVLEVMMAGRPTSDVVLKVRKHRDLKDLPILSFSVMDKENLGTKSLAEKTIEIDRARKLSLDAGATETMREMDEKFLSDFLALHLGT